MVLTIWIGIKRFRHSHNHLITVLYRDGIFYFVYLFREGSCYLGPSQAFDAMTSCSDLCCQCHRHTCWTCESQMIASSIMSSCPLDRTSSLTFSTRSSFSHHLKYCHSDLWRRRLTIRFQRIMHSVLSARIMLHMREAARIDGHEDKTADTSLTFMSTQNRTTEGTSVSA